MSMTRKESFQGIPKWALALAVGIPLSAGILYILNKRRNHPKPPASKKLIEEITDPFEKAQNLKNKGNKYFKANRYELAINCYTEAIKICPTEQTTDLATFYQNRAAAHEQLSNYKSVIQDCDSAISYNEKYIKAYDRRARIIRKSISPENKESEKITMLKQAMEDMTIVCILESFHGYEHVMMLKEIMKELGSLQASQIRRTRIPLLASKYLIRQYFNSYANDPVIQSIRETEISEEQDLHGFEYAKQLFKNEDFDNIIAACSEELKNENSAFIVEALLLRASFHILSRNEKAAWDDLSKVIDHEKSNTEIKVNAYIKRGILSIHEGRMDIYDESRFTDFESALKLDSKNSDIFYHMAKVHLLLENINDAIENYNRTIELNPNFPLAYFHLLYVYSHKNMMEENDMKSMDLLPQFNDFLTKYPDCLEAYGLYAQVLTQVQDYEAAKILYEKAEEKDPENVDLLVEHGTFILQSKGDIEASIKMIQKAIQLDNNCNLAYKTLGTIEVQRGNFKMAVELFDKAISLMNVNHIELMNLFGLRDSAIIQLKLASKFNQNL